MRGPLTGGPKHPYELRSRGPELLHALCGSSLMTPIAHERSASPPVNSLGAQLAALFRVCIRGCIVSACTSDSATCNRHPRIWTQLAGAGMEAFSSWRASQYNYVG